MIKEKPKDINSGDYVYSVYGDEYIVGKVLKIEQDGVFEKIWGVWVKSSVSTLPTTVEEFDALEKCELEGWVERSEITAFQLYGASA